jgi:hypothetical protein
VSVLACIEEIFDKKKPETGILIFLMTGQEGRAECLRFIIV